MGTQIDELAVFLALKDILQGENAQLRKQSKIQKLIHKNRSCDDVKRIIEAYNIDNVSVTAKGLLEQEIFHSRQKAEARFPEAFPVSLTRIVEQPRPANEAISDRVHNVQDVSKDPKVPASTVRKDESEMRSLTLDLECQNPLGVVDAKRGSTSTVAASWDSTYLPYETQHKLLNTVQQILERACFDFALLNLPKLVMEENWECCEAVELNHWSKVLGERRAIFFEEDLDELGKPFHDLLDSITKIRHTAVHRLRVDTDLLDLFLADAQSLAKLLHDEPCAKQLARLRHETHLTVEDIRRKRRLIESEYAAKMNEITARRVELDRLEQQAVADMLKEEKECINRSGLALSRVIVLPDRVLESTTATEQATPLMLPSDSEASGYRSCDSDASHDSTGDSADII